MLAWAFRTRPAAAASTLNVKLASAYSPAHIRAARTKSEWNIFTRGRWSGSHDVSTTMGDLFFTGTPADEKKRARRTVAWCIHPAELLTRKKAEKSPNPITDNTRRMKKREREKKKKSEWKQGEKKGEPWRGLGKGQRERVSWRSSDRDGSASVARASLRSAPTTVVQLSSGENSSFPIRGEKKEKRRKRHTQRRGPAVVQEFFFFIAGLSSSLRAICWWKWVYRTKRFFFLRQRNCIIRLVTYQNSQKRNGHN